MRIRPTIESPPREVSVILLKGTRVPNTQASTHRTDGRPLRIEPIGFGASQQIAMYRFHAAAPAPGGFAYLNEVV